VSITFLGSQTASLPLSLLLLLSVFVGVVFAAVSGFAREIELKRKIRRLEKRIAELSAPVHDTPRMERGPAHHVLPRV
jgi:cell division protein FtsB